MQVQVAGKRVERLAVALHAGVIDDPQALIEQLLEMLLVIGTFPVRMLF